MKDFEGMDEEEKKKAWEFYQKMKSKDVVEKGSTKKIQPKKQESIEDIKKFSDVATARPPIEGERVDMTDVLGKRLVLQDFRAMKSQFHEGDYSWIQVRIVDEDDRLVVFTTSSQVLLGQVLDLKDKLPVRAKIVKPEGKLYYTFTDW